MSTTTDDDTLRYESNDTSRLVREHSPIQKPVYKSRHWPREDEAPRQSRWYRDPF